jgi:acetyl esterase/lipase
VEKVSAAGVNCEWIIPVNACEDRVVVYLHGGGYVLGSLATARSLALPVARFSGERVLSVDYRLAPENPFPAALEDSLAVYQWILDKGIPSSKIVFIGDSAGGGLCLATILSLKNNCRPLPGGVICLSPWTDLAGTGDSIRNNLKIDPLFRKGGGPMKPSEYSGGESLTNPLVSPLYGDYHGFPPMLIHVGSDEVLLDDSVVLAEKARESGIDVTLKVWKGMWHVFHITGRMLPESSRSLKEISEFIKNR